MGKKEINNEQEIEILNNKKAEVKDELAALKEQLEESENKYRRALADYQNLQKRSFEDRAEWIKSSNKDLLLRILTVFDTLILAHQHLNDKNIQVSIDQFLDVLKSEGVVKIETVGKKFDPLLMEAVSTTKGDDGKVVHEARAGFLLHEKLLRAAQVIVGSSEV